MPSRLPSELSVSLVTLCSETPGAAVAAWTLDFCGNGAVLLYKATQVGGAQRCVWLGKWTWSPSSSSASAVGVPPRRPSRSPQACCLWVGSGPTEHSRSWRARNPAPDPRVPSASGSEVAPGTARGKPNRLSRLCHQGVSLACHQLCWQKPFNSVSEGLLREPLCCAEFGAGRLGWGY